MAALRSTVSDVERIIQPMPVDALINPFDAYWSMLDVVGHSIATDEMMGDRFRVILTADNPHVAGRIPLSAYCGQQELAKQVLSHWQNIRAELCAWLEQLPAGALTPCTA